MRHYETTFILRPNLGEDQFTEIIDRTCAIITDDGGAIIDTDRWGIKRLAYEIKKEVQGYYVCLNYAAPGKTISEIERIFRIDDRLLRFLTIKLADAITPENISREQEACAARAAEEEEEAETAEDAGAKKEEENTEEKKAENDTEKQPAPEATPEQTDKPEEETPAADEPAAAE